MAAGPRRRLLSWIFFKVDRLTLGAVLPCVIFLRISEIGATFLQVGFLGRRAATKTKTKMGFLGDPR